MTAVPTLDSLEVAGKRVLVRTDLNVPMVAGRVSDATRIDRAAETIRELAEKGARVIVMSHFGRPKGAVVPELSLAPIADPLARAVGRDVTFSGDPLTASSGGLADGDVALLENLRFHPGEEANDPAFAERLASLGDVYVDDAFSCAHRAHASIDGVARLLPAAAGRLMQAELAALEKALGAPDRPLGAVVGGAKVSTKLALLGNLVDKVDWLAIGGGMANTFLFAAGVDVGQSLCERDMAATAQDIAAAADGAGCRLILPTDVVVAEDVAAGSPHKVVDVADVPGDMVILDIGPASIATLAATLSDCKTLVWNGPLGAFEFAPFDAGTVAVARAAAARTSNGDLLTVAGGGDTLAALTQAGVADRFSYVSTAGGAFLEWLEGKELPGVAVLRGED